MTLGAVGAILFALLVYTCFRDRRGMFIAFVAVLLGVIIAGSDGPLASIAHTIIDAIRSAGTTVAGWIG